MVEIMEQAMAQITLTLPKLLMVLDTIQDILLNITHHMANNPTIHL